MADREAGALRIEAALGGRMQDRRGMVVAA
jgi:hypothetical protein